MNFFDLTLGLFVWINASTFPFSSTHEDWHSQLSQTPLYLCLFELLYKDCRQKSSWEPLSLPAGWRMLADTGRAAIPKARLVLEMTLSFLVLYMYELITEHYTKHFITSL